jgi:hypothetical protein
MEIHFRKIVLGDGCRLDKYSNSDCRRCRDRTVRYCIFLRFYARGATSGDAVTGPAVDMGNPRYSIVSSSDLP